MQTSRACGRTSRPATLEDLFHTLYRTDGAEVDLSGVRIIAWTPTGRVRRGDPPR